MSPDVQVSRSRLVATAVASILLVAAVYLVAVCTAFGQRLDEAAISRHYWNRSVDRDAVLYDRVILVSIAIVGAFAVWQARRRRPLAMAVVGSGIASVLISQGLRTAVLPRPDLGVFDSLYGPSFPSGHTAGIATVTLGLIAVGRQAGWRTRAVWSVYGASMACFVILIPIHRPADVIGGTLLALAGMSIAVAFVPGARASVGITRVDPVRSGAGRPLAGAGRAVSWVLGLAGLLVGAASLVLLRSPVNLGDLGPGFPIAIAVIVAVTTAVGCWFERVLSVDGPGGVL